MNEDRIADVFILVMIISVIILKLTNTIHVSWLWLTAVIWIPLLLGIVLSIIIITILLIKYIKERY